MTTSDDVTVNDDATTSDVRTTDYGVTENDDAMKRAKQELLASFSLVLIEIVELLLQHRRPRTSSSEGTFVIFPVVMVSGCSIVRNASKSKFAP